MQRLFLSLLASAVLSLGPAHSAEPTGNTLLPYGIDDSYPVQVRQVTPGSTADRYLDVGDVVLEVEGVIVNNITQFNEAVRRMQPSTITVRKRDGRIVQLPYSLIASSRLKTLFFQPLDTGETFTTERPDINGLDQPAGQFVVDGANGTILAHLWQGRGRYIEVDLSLTTTGDCNDCVLNTVAVMDLPSRTWLIPVPVTQVAQELHPSEAYPRREVVQPAPVLARLPSNMHAQGRVDHSFLGNAFLGLYPGVFGAYDRPGYDTRMPGIDHVLKTSNDDLIALQSRDRRLFAMAREGTLRTGTLRDRATYQGHLFYAAPTGYDGPYLVVVDGRGEREGVVRFEPPINVATLAPLTRGDEATGRRPLPLGFVQ